MRVLIACEFSGVVTNAFRLKGHEAWSCDILPTDSNPDWHIQGDVLKQLDKNWDMMIAHPPCTYLCNSGVSWLHKDESRWVELEKASEFFKTLLEYDIPKICVENPIPHKYGKLPKYSQIVQPYEYGHPERKATCLWLKNLPKLKPTNNVKDEMLKLPKTQQQRTFYVPIKDRAKNRSITFEGIAQAMVEQWGNV
tara:strand:+ start:610 stop:1194 length:585 start_codon:yes stop_codon:yes gene_type:complete